MGKLLRKIARKVYVNTAREWEIKCIKCGKFETVTAKVNEAARAFIRKGWERQVHDGGRVAYICPECMSIPKSDVEVEVKLNLAPVTIEATQEYKDAT